MRRIGEKTFDNEDQILFAAVSSDRNPMHMDPIASRRLLTGRQVVHGIHLLVTAIELWQRDDAHAVSIACTFHNPVSIGDLVVFTQSAPAAGAVTLQAIVRGALCAQITIATASTPISDEAESLATDHQSDHVPFPLLATPLDQDPQLHVGSRYVIALDDVDLPDSFQRASHCLGGQGLRATLALSYFVGMICPGLHSIFSSLSFTVNRAAEDQGRLRFAVRRYDPRFSLFDISFDGCIRGNIKAFVRPRPQDQPSVNQLSQHVDEHEFTGTRSLIVGGSRGLGELTAKILAAGGGDVVITYATGLADASRVRDEIRHAGKVNCEVMRVDVRSDSFLLSEIPRNLDAVYFFATPKIFRKQVDLFDNGVFQEFCDIYLRTFYELCVFIEAGAPATQTNVYFPSSVAVSERPKGMTEYAMAKAAAEVLIDDINRGFKKVKVVSSRLPRLRTDQTSTIMKVAAQSNVDTLLPIIRAVTRRTS